MNRVWLIPWHSIDRTEIRESLLKELHRELPSSHALSNEQLIPIGRRQDCDDILVALEDGRVAIVHLTWSGKREPVPDSPWTKLFDSFDHFVETEMKPAHLDWE